MDSRCSLLLVAVCIATGGLGARADAQQPEDIERRILLELFEATGGKDWTRKAGWGSDTPICEWEGVLCIQSTTITQLWLSDNNLRGVLPARIADLRELKVLNLARNKLTGNVPDTLLKRADDNTLELSLSENAFAELIMRVSIYVTSYLGVCSDDMAPVRGNDRRIAKSCKLPEHALWIIPASAAGYILLGRRRLCVGNGWRVARASAPALGCQ